MNKKVYVRVQTVCFGIGSIMSFCLVAIGLILVQDAIKYENGRQIRGSSIVVEWTKGAVRRPGARPDMVS